MPNNHRTPPHRQAQGKFAQGNTARKNLHKALIEHQATCQQQPGNPDAWYVLAGIYAQLGRITDVEHCCRQVIQLQNSNATARYNLGVALQQQGKIGPAIACYQELLKIQPDHAAAHANLGLIYHEHKQPDKAETHAQRAIVLDPRKVAAHNTLGLVYLEQGRYSEAIVHFQVAIQLDRSYANGHYNLGLSLLRSDAPEAAAEHFKLALTLDPDNPETLNDLGSACKAMGKFEESLKHYTRAIELNPDYAEAHWNRSLILLLMGNYAAGWKEYEWRWKSENRRPRELAGAAWQGEPLGDRRILIYSEQGLGDAIQFIRYAQQLKNLGATVLAEVPGTLSRILTTCAGIDHLITQGGKLPAFDYHAPLLSLPGILNTCEDTIPANIPYLHPPGDGNRAISSIFSNSPGGLRAGIVWAGSPQHANDRNRSCPATHFSTISSLHGIQLFSLQKGPPEQELPKIDSADLITDLSGQLNDFADTAQVLEHLDLLITVDTSVAHLAGAMGRPVWVLLPFVPDWRWQLNRDDSPWYPTMRLFRQQHPGNWAGVFEKLRHELVVYAESKKTGIIT